MVHPWSYSLYSALPQATRRTLGPGLVSKLDLRSQASLFNHGHGPKVFAFHFGFDNESRFAADQNALGTRERSSPRKDSLSLSLNYGSLIKTGRAAYRYSLASYSILWQNQRQRWEQEKHNEERRDWERERERAMHRCMPRCMAHMTHREGGN